MIFGWTIIQIIIGLAILSLLVFVHEFGHFIVAKKVGIRVITFSIGFGRKILRWRRGETEYRLSALPFGGYVKLAGQEPDDDSIPDERDFRSKKIWQRAAAVIAGPGANYVFAILVLWIIYMAGVHESVSQNDLTVGAVADSSAAGREGIKIGDRLMELDGKKISNWDQYYSKIIVSAGQRVKVAWMRGDKTYEKEMIPAGVEVEGMGRYGDLGVYSVEKPVVGAVFDSSAAAVSGLMPGDTVVSINNQKILSWGQMVSLVQVMNTEGKFRIKRRDSTFTASITPRYNQKENRHMIGIAKAPPELVVKRYGPVNALVKAVRKGNDIMASMWYVIKALFKRSVSPKSLAGPVGIVQMTGTAARAGFDALAFFLALISINLAIVNLLPLAITDGGVLFFLALEKLRGKPLSCKIQIRIQQGALYFFIALFLFVTLNDLQRFTKFLPH